MIKTFVLTENNALGSIQFQQFTNKKLKLKFFFIENKFLQEDTKNNKQINTKFPLFTTMSNSRQIKL